MSCKRDTACRSGLQREQGTKAWGMFKVSVEVRDRACAGKKWVRWSLIAERAMADWTVGKAMDF